MIRQEAITKNVIAADFLQSQGLGMLTHDEIRAELIRQIDAGKVKQAAVARKLCIAPARVAEIRNGTRRIQPDEMPELAVMLGLVREPTPGATPIESVSNIPNWGKVAQGVWMEQSTVQEGGVAYDRTRWDAPATDLFAVTPEGRSMNLRFLPGTQLICRKIPFGSGAYASGDYVIAERTAHDLHEMTCKRLSVDDDGVHWLHSESDDPQFSEPWRIGKPDTDHHDDMEIRILGKVVRAVQDFERRS